MEADQGKVERRASPYSEHNAVARCERISSGSDLCQSVLPDAFRRSWRLQIIFRRWPGPNLSQVFQNIRSRDYLDLVRWRNTLIGRSYDFQTLQSEAYKAMICGALHGLVCKSAELDSSGLLMVHRH